MARQPRLEDDRVFILPNLRVRDSDIAEVCRRRPKVSVVGDRDRERHDWIANHGCSGDSLDVDGREAQGLEDLGRAGVGRHSGDGTDTMALMTSEEFKARNILIYDTAKVRTRVLLATFPEFRQQ